MCQCFHLHLRVSSSVCYFDKSVSWFLIAAKFYFKTFIRKHFFKGVKNEFKAILCSLKCTQFNCEFILHFLEQLFANLSFKNENSPFVIKNHDVLVSQ